MREVKHLNFGWRFSPDYKPEYIRTDYKDTTFRLVDIPHICADGAEDAAPDKKGQQIYCYRKMFVLPDSMKERRLILHFDGIMGCAAVFVNGKPVCAHRGGYTPFSCDITADVTPQKKDGDTLITVVVDSDEREDTAPCGDLSERAVCGGIYRGVWLEAVEQCYVTGVQLRTHREKEGWSLDINGTLSEKETAEVRMYLYDGDSRMSGKYLLCQDGSFSYRTGLLTGIREWSPEQPKLYKLVVTLGNGDSYSQSFGFREAEFRPEGFFLNDDKLRLIGLNRSQDYYRTGIAMPPNGQAADVKLLKELGCNIVRIVGGSPSVEFLDACDSMGLLVIEGLQGKGYIGGKEWKQCLLDNFREQIIRDRNHPCIVLWETRIEEAQDDDALFNSAYRLAMELDGTRQTTGVRSVACTEPIHEDVFSYSDHGEISERAAPEKRRNVCKARIPYLVSGFGGGSLYRSGDSCVSATEQALYHAHMLDAAYGDGELCGVIGSCLADSAAAPGYGGRDRVIASGVTDIYRMKKPAAYVYETQSAGYPVMELISSLSEGDDIRERSAGVYVITNCDSVRVYRDGKEVGEFYPDRKKFPNLPHPPILVDDFIGSLLMTEDNIESKDAALVKNTLTAIYKDSSSTNDGRYRAAASALKNKLTGEQLCSLYKKYYAGGLGGSTLRFDGIRAGKVSLSIVSEPVLKTGIRISCDKSELLNATIYDTARIELTAVDKNGLRDRGCYDAVSVECEGSLEVIGSRLLSLRGGGAAFYVRTKGGKGAAKAIITTETLGTHTVEFDIKRVTDKNL